MAKPAVRSNPSAGTLAVTVASKVAARLMFQ